jgi:hypothetical protein
MQIPLIRLFIMSVLMLVGNETPVRDRLLYTNYGRGSKLSAGALKVTLSA